MTGYTLRFPSQFEAGYCGHIFCQTNTGRKRSQGEGGETEGEEGKGGGERVKGGRGGKGRLGKGAKGVFRKFSR